MLSFANDAVTLKINTWYLHKWKNAGQSWCVNKYLDAPVMPGEVNLKEIRQIGLEVNEKCLIEDVASYVWLMGKQYYSY